MGLFGFGKNRDVVDLAERYRKQKEREANMREDIGSNSSQASQTDQATSASPFSFFDSGSSSFGPESSESDSDGFVDLASSSTEKRRRLAKRILDMTTKIEDLSNQIYHLQQRIEVLERKNNVSSFD